MTLPRLLVALAALAVVALPSSAVAADGSFQPTCRGSAKLGENREEGQVAYRFFCDANIAGFSLVALNRTVDAFDTEPVVLTPAGDPVPGQDFGCSGEIPGIGVGCGGLAGAWNHVNGALTLSTDPCGPGRPRFALTVADAKGRTAGPYRLFSAKSGGALNGCPAKSSRKRAARPVVRR